MKRSLDFGSWPSALGALDIANGVRRLSQPQCDKGLVYWLEARPSEGGRQVVMCASASDAHREVSSAAWNVRTRVHDYGGGDYLISDGDLFGVSFDDQILYRGSEPISLPGNGYANMVRSPDRNWLVAVEESPREGSEPENRLVAFSLTGRREAPVVVAAGHDFVSSPCFSPDGTKLAFLAWDHPDMPWDSTRLFCVGWSEAGVTGTPREIAGGPNESVLQPRFSPSGRLTFVSDRDGFWNLYQRTDAGDRALCSRQAEFAMPHWVFGISNYDFVDENRILCSFRETDGDRLAVLDVGRGRLDRIPLPFTEMGGVCIDGSQAAFLAAGPRQPAGVYAVDLNHFRYQLLRSGKDEPWKDEWISSPEVIEFSTGESRTAHGFFYPPRHPSVEGPSGSKPPLLVKSHGGPTSQASFALDYRTQYWTSRGFAVVDVNYGGSTGYGREFRDRLNGNWGVVDVEDCASQPRVSWLAKVGSTLSAWRSPEAVPVALRRFALSPFTIFFVPVPATTASRTWRPWFATRISLKRATSTSSWGLIPKRATSTTSVPRSTTSRV